MATTSPAGAADRWLRRLFGLSVVLVSFGLGAYAMWSGMFPSDTLSRSFRTASFLWGTLGHVPVQGGYVAGVPPDSVEARRVRWKPGEGLQDPVVVKGGRWFDNKRCPEADGCLAVEYAEGGRAGRTWPFRADVIRGLIENNATPLERVAGKDVADYMQGKFMSMYANGDVLVSFHVNRLYYPAFAGIGRFGSDGRPLWFNGRYYHHEAHITAGDSLWTPTTVIEESPFTVRDREMWRCDTGYVQIDQVHMLDEKGETADSLSIVDAFLASHWGSKLAVANSCDPFHVNSASIVGKDVSGLDDVRSGDVVLSLAHMDAFVIIGRETRMLKRYVEGTFVRQHSVKHLRGPEFLLFDNLGGYGVCGGEWKVYSRVLVVNAASGEETVVFPRDIERYCGWSTRLRGRVSISPDRTRVVASFTGYGRAVEVRIADGEVLAEFDFVSDARDTEWSSNGNVVRFHTEAFYSREAR